MKKTYFTLISCIILVSTITSYSQEYLEKGSFMIGGGISYGKSTSENNNITTDQSITNSITNFSFSPYFGKFIKDNLLVGGGLNYSSSLQEYNSEINNINNNINEDRNTTIGVSIFIRKVWPIKERFGAFLQPHIGYSTTKRVNESIFNENTRNFEYDYNTVSIGTSLGMYYFISDRFSLETTFGNMTFQKNFETRYNYENFIGDIEEQEQSSSSFSLNFINTISFNKLFTINYFF